MVAQVGRERFAGHHLDEPRGNLIVGVVIVPLRAGPGHQTCRTEAGHGFGERAGLLAAEGVHGRVRETGGLLEQLPHRDVGTARVRDPELGQVVDDGVVEAQATLVDELHDGEGCERLAE